MNESVATEIPHEQQAEEGHSGLLSASFIGLLLTQLLTAINDNIFRWLAIGIGKDYVTRADQGRVLMAGTASFVLPYILLAAPAGYLADRYGKRDVIFVCKVAEIVLMILGVVAIVHGSLIWIFVVLALMGAQSALFSPAKLGCIPELLHPSRIPAANGLFGLATVAATVIGMAVGSQLTDLTKPKGQTNWWITAVVVIGVAVVGTALSLLIHRTPARDPSRRFPWDAPARTLLDLRTLYGYRALFRVALGLVFFWSVGSLAQLNIDQFALEGNAENEVAKTPMLAALVFGVGVGSVLAGLLSRGRIELGILPIGAFGVAVSSMMLFTVKGEIFHPQAQDQVSGLLIYACVLLFFLGTSAGLFSVPLESYIQHRSPAQERGSILAATNFLVFSGVLLFSILYYGLRYPVFEKNQPLFSARQIFLLAGLGTFPVLIYIVWVIPQASVRFLVWLASHTLYRIRVFHRELLPETGGAMLAANHVTWLDGVFLLLTTSRPVRFLVYAPNFQNRFLKWLADLAGAIMMEPKPKSIARALNEARQALEQGEIVCIFPEGGITRTGQLQAFKPGIMKVLHGSDAPVIPVYLDGLWGSIFSFERGKFFWKMPQRVPYPVNIYFGKPLGKPQNVHEIRQAVQVLSSHAVEQRSMTFMSPPRTFLRRCKSRLFKRKVVDSTGADLTGGSLLLRSLIARRLLRRILAPTEQNIGVLLPPAAGAVVVNAALALDRRVACNLNYTVTSEVNNACIQQAGIRHVLTSRKFMEKMNFNLNAEIVYLEDLKDKPTLIDKLAAALGAYVLPSAIVERQLGLTSIKNDDLLTIIFTSGSTGVPKGVMLSHANVASNVVAVGQMVHLRDTDVVIGILPFFHSFGYTVTMWTVLCENVVGAYHFSPLDAKQIGKLCRENGGTILLATPTFLRSYIRRCDEQDFATLDVVVVGAEKLPKDLSDAFEAKFHVRPVEGYGATELSPLVSVNVPPSRSIDNFQPDAREGSVGRPIPGVSAKVVNPESGAELGVNADGMLWIRGPNVMKGYLGRDDLTSSVVRDGWYVTGDIAHIDDDGFIWITGRESRFSKIGGEMVPHIQIEEHLNRLLGATEDGSLRAIVTAVPDERKGERLVVLHVKIDRTPEELRKGLMEAGLPNIFIPGADSFFEIAELPVLGSGKLDLKAIKQIAIELTGKQQGRGE